MYHHCPSGMYSVSYPPQALVLQASRILFPVGGVRGREKYVPPTRNKEKYARIMHHMMVIVATSDRSNTAVLIERHFYPVLITSQHMTV